MQSQNFKDTKEKLYTMEHGTVLVGGDFAENFSPVVQDAVQSHHWNKQQTTIHPWIVYYYDSEKKEVAHVSLAAISDRIVHDPASVAYFHAELINQLKFLNIVQ